MYQPSTCNCAEAFRTGSRERLPFSPFHNCAEVARRNRFLPAALQIARRQTNGMGMRMGSIARSVALTRALSNAMEALCSGRLSVGKEYDYSALPDFELEASNGNDSGPLPVPAQPQAK